MLSGIYEQLRILGPFIFIFATGGSFLNSPGAWSKGFGFKQSGCVVIEFVLRPEA